MTELDAALTTPQARIAWFCEHFDVTPPTLAYDDEEPDQILLTNDLIRWCRIEGVEVGWMISGEVAGALATHREKHRMTPDLLELHDAFADFTKEEVQAVVDAVERGQQPGADFEAEVKKAVDQIKAGWAAA